KLVTDIKTNGLLEEIVLYDGMVLDGRNRYRACLAADVVPTTINADKWIKDPTAYVISANIHRRHLTAEQKRELIAKLIKAQPEKSNRQIAATAKASPTTVGAERAKMEAKGDVSKLDTRRDTKGRKQPGNKKTVERKSSKRQHQLEVQQSLEAFRRRVATILMERLMERLDRDDLTLLYAALDAVGDEPLKDAIKERAGINPDAVSCVGAEELFENAEHYGDFAENLRKAEIELEAARPTDALAGNDPGTILVEDGSVSKPQPSIAAPSREPALAVDPWDGLDIPDCLRRVPKALTS